MPTVQIADGFGLAINASPSFASVFMKYLKTPGSLEVKLTQLKATLQDLQVGQDPFDSQTIGLSFQQPFQLGNTGVELTISPQFSGSIAINKGPNLFDADSDPFRDSIPVPPNQAFVSLGLNAEIDAGLADTVGDLQFGITAGTQATYTNYSLFAQTDLIFPAIKKLFENFIIPGDLEDVEAMAPGSVATVDGTGTLKFSAQANLLSVVNPLAIVGTLVKQLAVKVTEGGSLTVGATYTLTGEYQVRVRRLDGRRFQLGIEKMRSSEWVPTIDINFIGASANLGSYDLIQTVLQTISPDPIQDAAAFQKATGLSDAQVATIAAAIQAGIERSLQIDLSASLDFLGQTSTAFSYEIDLAKLDPAGKAAVNKALSGDLRDLEGQSLSGVKPLKSVLSTLREGKQTLRFNLLGIFNFASVNDFVQEGTIIVDRESGEITITDSATANRISFTSDNFAKNSSQLRKILAESFLMSVAYRASQTVPMAPKLKSSYWFFELQRKTNPQNIADYLNIAQSLKLISPQAAADRLSSLRGVNAFGRSTARVEANYSDPISKSLFLNASRSPRSQVEYEKIGRQALALLLPAQDPNNIARRLPLTDDSIWAEMKNRGTGNDFAGLFNDRGFNANQLGAIHVDYLLIMWWALAMSDMAHQLANMLGFIAQNPQWDPENNTFKKLRGNLDDKLASVARNTKDEFAEPWGLLAMDLASGQIVPTTVNIDCSRLTLAEKRTLT